MGCLSFNDNCKTYRLVVSDVRVSNKGFPRIFHTSWPTCQVFSQRIFLCETLAASAFAPESGRSLVNGCTEAKGDRLRSQLLKVLNPNWTHFFSAVCSAVSCYKQEPDSQYLEERLDCFRLQSLDSKTLESIYKYQKIFSRESKYFRCCKSLDL